MVIGSGSCVTQLLQVIDAVITTGLSHLKVGYTP